MVINMVRIQEFKNVNEINEYFDSHKMMHQFEVIPIERRFINPNTKMMTSCMTYVLIMNE